MSAEQNKDRTIIGQESFHTKIFNKNSSFFKHSCQVIFSPIFVKFSAFKAEII